MKHLLLRAETELAAEKLKNAISEPNLVNADEARLATPLSSLGEGEDSGRLVLVNPNESLQSQIEELKTTLAGVVNERDAIKTSLLELEIANHEGHEAKDNQTEHLKVEMAK